MPAPYMLRCALESERVAQPEEKHEEGNSTAEGGARSFYVCVWEGMEKGWSPDDHG